MATTIEELEARRRRAELGGGEARIAAQHKKGRIQDAAGRFKG